MALYTDFAAETAVIRNHANCSGAVGDLKAGHFRILVNRLYSTGNRAYYNTSLPLFLSNKAILIGGVLPVRAKEEDYSSNLVQGTATLQNVYFEQEDGIVDGHPLLNTVQNFSVRLQTFTAKGQIYCDNLRKVTAKVYFFPATLQFYSDKVQTFTARVRIVGAKVQNDVATVKNEVNRTYPLCSKHQPFTFCNQAVCAITYPLSCSFKPSMYNSKF